MPQRFIHAAEHLWRWFVVLWEPGIMAAAAGAGAVLVSTAEAAGDATATAMAITAFAVGFWADIMIRGRAWSARPAAERRSRLAEWKDRLTWAALGLAFGVLLAFVLNGMIARRFPDDAMFLAVLINFMCVLNALLIIDLIRGMGRLLSGQSTQEALAGLVIGCARRRAGDQGQDRRDGEGGS